MWLKYLKIYHGENAEKLADLIVAYNNPKKEKCALHWLTKKTIELPKDQQDVDNAFNIIDKLHLDFQKFDSPSDVVNRDDMSTRRANEKFNSANSNFDPEKEPTFLKPAYNAGDRCFDI